MAIAAAHPTHRWMAESDEDNMECVYCMCRPYGQDAIDRCPESPPPGDPYHPSKQAVEYPDN